MIELLNEIKSKRKVICITGGLASGKTLAMSYIANELQKELNIKRTFSNYDLSFGQPTEEIDYSKVYCAEDYTLFCIDEGDSVLSVSPAFMGHLFSDYMKKQKIIVLLTSQQPKRIRGEHLKKIDLFLKTEREDGEEIEVTSSPLPYRKKIKIADENIFYGMGPARYRI